MRVVGLAVEAHAGAATCSLVCIELAGDAPTIVETAETGTANGGDAAAQLQSVYSWALHNVGRLQPDCVVLRQADPAPRGRGGGVTTNVKVRLMCEGAIAAGARDKCVDVRVAPGAEIGRWYGGTKAEVDAEAGRVLNEWAGKPATVGARKKLIPALAAAVAASGAD
jgi:hypothetical protein